MSGSRRTPVRRLVPLAVALLLAGCADTDPYLRPGMWQPSGANALNLAAMVANPRDLIRGHGERGNSAAEAVPPVTRLWSGRVATLPNSSAQTGQGGPATPPPPATP